MRRCCGCGIRASASPPNCCLAFLTFSRRRNDRWTARKAGLGIGLCLVQRLVEMHGGKVEVYSALGQGSEFVVRLPVMADARNAAAVDTQRQRRADWTIPASAGRG